MRSVIWALLIAGSLAVALAGGGDPASVVGNRSLGYSIGYQVGDDFRRQGLEIDPDLLIQGIRDALEGSEPLLTPVEMNRSLSLLQGRAAAARKRTREEEQGFLEENARRDGVTTLPSGLQYEVLRPGTGARPSADDTVTIHYRGTLVDGTEFDSSHGRSEPASFVVGNAIPGWAEALQLMQEGARWRIFVPADLGYGDQAPAQVGPDRTVIFEIELISVVRPD